MPIIFGCDNWGRMGRWRALGRAPVWKQVLLMDMGDRERETEAGRGEVALAGAQDMAPPGIRDHRVGN